MYSVTRRVSNTQQPKNGFLPVSCFEKIANEEIEYFSNFWDVDPSAVGLAVDYLTRFMLAGNVEAAFRISLKGAYLVKETEKAQKLCSKITGLDDKSIRAACILVQYDVFARNPFYYLLELVSPMNKKVPGKRTINLVKKMVERALERLNDDRFQMCGITFEGGYSDIVSSGDADFITGTTLWDMKVSQKKRPSSKETLQLLMYYIMGCHSIHKEIFNRLTHLAIINPYYDIVYRYPTKNINQSLISLIEDEVICYNKTIQEVQEKCHSKQYLKIKSGQPLSTIEVGELLGVSKECVLSLVQLGAMNAVRQGPGYLYNPDELLDWCDEEKIHIRSAKWDELGTQLYGSNRNNWKFKCPRCGNIATVSDYPPQEGLSKLYTATHRCINFYKSSKDSSTPICHYQYLQFDEDSNELAAGGIVLLDNNGKKHHIFEFADEITDGSI